MCIVCFSSFFCYSSEAQRQEEQSCSVAALGGSRASSCDAGVGAALRGAKEGNTMSLEEGKTVEVVNRRMPDSVVYRKDSPFPWGSKYSASTGSTSPAFYLQETWSSYRGDVRATLLCIWMPDYRFKSMGRAEDPPRSKQGKREGSHHQPVAFSIVE